MNSTQVARLLVKTNTSKQALVSALTSHLRAQGLSKYEAAMHALFHYNSLISEVEGLGFELRMY